MRNRLCCVKVAAGGALFHVVVDDDHQSKMLLSKLAEDRRSGRVTVLPLSKLHEEAVHYPTEFGDDAKPLASYLKCDKHLKKALQHVSLPSPILLVYFSPLLVLQRARQIYVIRRPKSIILSCSLIITSL